MELGIIKGYQIAKNKDGDKTRLLLQVEILPEDVRNIELISMAGEDTNPAEGCRVLVIDASKGYKIGIAVTDDLIPEVGPGEKEIYSTDSPATTKKARIKLSKDSEVILNQGTDFAVAYTDLKTAFDKLKTDLNNFISVFNSHVHPGVTAGGASTSATITPGTASTADMSASKVEKVKLP
jgi:hypothetical protein